MVDPVGAAIAFAALGANTLALTLLLLFNPRHREVRWYTLFLTAISLWLLAQGILATTGNSSTAWVDVYAGAITALPGLFLIGSLSQRDDLHPATLPCLLAVTALAVPVGIHATTRPAGTAVQWTMLVWQVAGWAGGSWVHWLESRRERPDRPHRRRIHRVLWGLLLMPGLVVAAGMALGAERFFLYGMPLLIFVIHVLVFIGVVWLRFYDIEVRAARSGETAGRAVEAERLAAVGELAASVAHEVRNPLTGVRSLAQRMAEEDVDPARWRRYAAVIVEEVGRVDRIIANLLGVARRMPGHDADDPGAVTPLEPLFEDVLLLTGARARRAGIELQARSGGLEAPAPRQPLAQVLLNLVLNAVQHSPHGGVVHLEATGDAGTVTLLVRDQGPGVPTAERDRIFEPFHSAGTDGTGLGLSIVRRIARERGWSVSVGDGPGGGAEFRVVVRRPHTGATTPAVGRADAGVGAAEPVS